MVIFFHKQRTIEENRLVSQLIEQKIGFVTEGPSYICPIINELIDDGNNNCPYSWAVKCLERYGGLQGSVPEEMIWDPFWGEFRCEIHEEGRCPYNTTEEMIRRYGEQ